MSADHWRKELLRDLQRAVKIRRIIYLEGKTDIDVFAALISKDVAIDDVYDGVVVCGLRANKGGSGGNTLEMILQLADELGLRENISIIRDGDGQPYSQVSTSFHGAGPLYVWPTYCIENLLAQVEGGWPDGWGEEPRWAEVMREYRAYVGLNVVHMQLQQSLKTLELATFTNPAVSRPLLDAAQVQQKLEADRALIAGYDVAAAFSRAVTAFDDATLAASLEEAHAMLNGKWLVHDLARRRSRLDQDDCRRAWCQAVREAGGHPAVRAWWARVTA